MMNQDQFQHQLMILQLVYNFDFLNVKELQHILVLKRRVAK